MVEVDDMISKLAEEMKEATSKDLEANQNNKPALAKIKLLPKVIQVLEKTYLHEQLIDNEILEPIRMLEPMDDESLPTLSIRRPLLELLRKMPIAPEDIRPLS
jgi:transcription factor SPN1